MKDGQKPVLDQAGILWNEIEGCTRHEERLRSHDFMNIIRANDLILPSRHISQLIDFAQYVLFPFRYAQKNKREEKDEELINVTQIEKKEKSSGYIFCLVL